MRSIAGGGAGASAGACATSGNGVAAAQSTGKKRKCQMGRLNRRRRSLFVLVLSGFFFLHFFLDGILVEVLRFFSKELRMKLTGKFFNGGDNPRSWTVHGVADHGITAVADGVHYPPAGKSGKSFETRRRRFRMRGRKGEVVRLQASGFFETDLRPVLLSIHDGDTASVAESIGDESVLANRDERLVPNNEEDTLCRRRRKALLQSRKLMLHFGSHGSAGVRNAQKIGELFRRSDDVIHGVRVGGVGRDSQVIQSMDGLKAVQTFSHEDEIRMEGGNLFETGVDGATDLGFFLGIGRIVAKFRIADQAVLQTESIDSFGKARSQGHDATNGLRNADGPAGFIGDFTVDRGDGRKNSSTLSTGGRRPQQQSSCCKSHRLEKLLGQAAHESPTARKVPLSKQKSPTRQVWGFRHRSFSRRARPSAAREGGLAYGS